MNIEKAIMRKSLKAGGTVYLRGHVYTAPIPPVLLKQDESIVQLVKSETPQPVEIEPTEESMFDEQLFISSWIKLRAKTYRKFMFENLSSFAKLSKIGRKKAISKWEKLYDTNCPIF